MRVAMEANFVACVADGRAVFWECVESVAGNEPRCLDLILVEEFEKSPRALGSCPKPCSSSGTVCSRDVAWVTSADVARGIFASVGA